MNEFIISRLLITACLVIGSTSFSTAQDAISGRRMAILIGNGSYSDFEIKCVQPSLNVVEKAAKSNGYIVQRYEDLKKDDFKNTLETIVASTPTNATVLIYYCGIAAHTQRFDKYENLLRPIGESYKNEGDYRGGAINVVDVAEKFHEHSGARHTILLLDAAWQSPLKPDSDKIANGLHEFEPPTGTTVLFSAKSGVSKSPPIDESASLFSQAVAKHLKTFDTSIREATQSIANDMKGSWASDAIEAGIGSPSPLTVVDKLQPGESAGDGFTNSVGMTFRWCPPGEFTMGSIDNADTATRDREPVKVVISRGFFCGQYEVTQREYEEVAGRKPGADFTLGKNVPYWGATEVKSVTDFCKKLTERDRQAGVLPDGWEYACPTEAQWEYACRADSKTPFHFGDSANDLGNYANFADASLHAANPDYYWANRESDDGVGESLANVGSYRPNAWGIHDMHGNVAELVADHYREKLPGGTDPLVKLEKNGLPVIRGGAWCSIPLYCESSFRNTISGRDKRNYIGFRIVLQQKK